MFVTATQRVRRRATSRESERTIYFLLEFRNGRLLRPDGWHLPPIARGVAGLAD